MTEKQAPSDAPPKPFEFVVEFGDQKNSNFMWPLDQRVLRGRWTRNNLPGVTHEGAPEFGSLPDIPGMRLALSSVKKSAKFFDVLENENEDPRIAAVLEKAQRVLNAVFSIKFGPEIPIILKDLSENELKSHAYWVRRMFDNRSVLIISGRIPEIDEIVSMPGLIKFEGHDSSPLVIHDKPAPHRYIARRFIEEDAKNPLLLDKDNSFLYRRE